jgi:uncharacterized DUF497 family protein
MDKSFQWNDSKNQKLIADRGISFEEAVFSIMNGGVIDIVKHPNDEKIS